MPTARTTPAAAPSTVRRRGVRAPAATPWRLLTGLLLLAGFGATIVNWPAPRLPADAARLEIELDGLDCAFWCPVGVDTVLHDLPGLEVRMVDVTSGTVVVAHDPRQIAAATIVQRLAEHWRVRRARSIAQPGLPGHELDLTPPTATPRRFP